MAHGIPLLGMVGRLVEQKGVDVILDAPESLLKLPIQIVILGTAKCDGIGFFLEKSAEKYIHLYNETIKQLSTSG